MKYLFIAILFCAHSFSFSQTWRGVNQSYLNVKYKLPSTWEVDGFGADFGAWDQGGSSVCDCAGTINFGPDRKLGMVIYPTDSKTDAVKRTYVWDFHFAPSTKTETYTTKKLSFAKTTSIWEKENPTEYDVEMMDDEVWRFQVTGPEYAFIVYFWADPSVLKTNEKTIHTILESFLQVKK